MDAKSSSQKDSNNKAANAIDSKNNEFSTDPKQENDDTEIFW